jgi:drug/metabolite transporter (DMT)-like permease
MSPVALTLVLAAACFHALWNLTLHAAGDRVATMAVSGLLAGVVLLPAVLVSPPPARVLPLVVLSATAESAYAICLSAAYRRGALSLAYPLGRGTAPLLVTLGGWLVLGQRPGALALTGAACLTSGLAVVALSGRRAGQSGAVGFALLTGTAIASYSVIDARAVRDASPPAYLGLVLLLTGVMLSGWMGREGTSPPAPLRRGEGRRREGSECELLPVSRPAPPSLDQERGGDEWGLGHGQGDVRPDGPVKGRGDAGTIGGRLRAAWGTGARVAFGSTAAYLLVLLAFQRAAAGRVSTMREVSILIGIALAGEQPGRRVWLGATRGVGATLVVAAMERRAV